METQGWQLKRLLTFTKNRLANRPNRPRDPILRSYMDAIGITWPELEQEPGDESGSESSSDDDGEEGSGSDTSNDDLPVEDMTPGLDIFLFDDGSP